MKSIKAWLLFFIAALFISGLTAIPMESELDFLTRCIPIQTNLGAWIEESLFRRRHHQ